MQYVVLEPTLSLVHGPNIKEKIYNDVSLKYARSTKTNKLLDYAQVQCVVEIPKIVQPKKKKCDQKHIPREQPKLKP